MSAVSNVRSMRAFVPEQDAPEATPEWNLTNSLDKHIAQARKEMGEARWAELNAEWDDAISHTPNPGVSQWKAGAR